MNTCVKPLYIQNAQVLYHGQFHPMNLLLQNGLIRDIFTKDTSFTEESVDTFDATGLTVLPGFIDIHTHGGNGVDFNHANTSEVKKTAHFFATRGVTSFLPAILTDSPEVTKKQLSTVTDPTVCAECPQLIGVHLEGPFLNAQYKGAQPEQFLRPCDYDFFEELQTAAHGKIALVTLAPELDGSTDFIQKVTAQGVRVSLGHTAANYEQAMDAIKAGANSATHVMNAMKLLHMHDPAVLTAVLESDCYAEMICDGFHLHPPIIRLLLKTKGLERIIAVTDSIMAAGLPDGDYVLGANKVIVKDGDAKTVLTGARAGSTLTMDKALRNILAFTGLPVESVSKLLSENPARLLGIFDQTGSIEKEKQADLVFLDSQNEVKLTIIRGKIAQPFLNHSK